MEGASGYATEWTRAYAFRQGIITRLRSTRLENVLYINGGLDGGIRRLLCEAVSVIIFEIRPSENCSIYGSAPKVPNAKTPASRWYSRVSILQELYPGDCLNMPFGNALVQGPLPLSSVTAPLAARAGAISWAVCYPGLLVQTSLPQYRPLGCSCSCSVASDS